ncbi:multicopper polyphenol oxidase [Desulfosarcina alkanivorans]|uniref:Multicopper polyphenol oxidase n=1 Tax=Desulfosarcina alkanivorans TaxID=571177 RepID=A0A5K7YVZ1_9BACT|nr:polyphenol oxidase family protein [Desulfosarcina alkanivorans]BBO72575.1 multicopper polyphenol oxidase [Desulfosarcina alkanivorans]
MLLVKKKDNYFFQFPALSRFPGLTHAIACRSGGFSRAPFAGLNLSPGVGDEPEAVAANRRRLLARSGGGIHVYTRQNHGTAIRVVSREAWECGEPIQTGPVSADALITNVPGIRLLIQTADCQAVMLFDPQKRVVANVHCGWRGSVADILGDAVSVMSGEFGCDPGRLIAAIGPSLGPCCAEFINYEKEIPRPLWPFRVGPHHFDFWRISRHQLAAAGLAADNVHGPGVCTRCNPHLFFSYRAARKTGRFAALIGMDADSD